MVRKLHALDDCKKKLNFFPDKNTKKKTSLIKIALGC